MKKKRQERNADEMIREEAWGGMMCVAELSKYRYHDRRRLAHELLGVIGSVERGMSSIVRLRVRVLRHAMLYSDARSDERICMFESE